MTAVSSLVAAATRSIAILWSNVTGRGDWGLDASGRLLTAPAIESAVWVSLFTDRRAAVDDKLTDGSQDRRGWWADAYSDKPIGSRLWLLRRAARIQQTLDRAEVYAREALAWLVEDGVAVKVDVTAEWGGPTFMVIRPVIYHTDGRRFDLGFDWAWQGA